METNRINEIIYQVGIGVGLVVLHVDTIGTNGIYLIAEERVGVKYGFLVEADKGKVSAAELKKSVREALLEAKKAAKERVRVWCDEP